MTKTTLPSIKEVESTRKWHHFDAQGKTLGRLATQIVVCLMGKNKRTFTPHIDCGDFVVVTNAAKIKVTGNKAIEKVYFSHSGYAKGGKETPFKDMLAKNPTRVLELAVYLHDAVQYEMSRIDFCQHGIAHARRFFHSLEQGLVAPVL